MRVNVILQNENAPHSYYASTPAALGADWQQFSATGQVNDTGEVPLMIQASRPLPHFRTASLFGAFFNTMESWAGVSPV
jgi:hypothetical protein